MKNVLLLLVGWINHISAILIMSQDVGLSSDEKKALELRTRELGQAIESSQHSAYSDRADSAANGIVYRIEWVDADTIRLTPTEEE